MHRLCNLVLSKPIPTDVSSRSMADSRDKLHLTRHHPSMHRTSRHASLQHVATYQVDLPVLKFSLWKVTFQPFSSFNRIFCARRIIATRESLFQKLARRDNATPPFSCGRKRRKNATHPVIVDQVSLCTGLWLTPSFTSQPSHKGKELTGYRAPPVRQTGQPWWCVVAVVVGGELTKSPCVCSHDATD